MKTPKNLNNFYSVAVKIAIELAGTQAALGKICGVTQQSVAMWLKTGKIPPKYVIKIEENFNGLISRHSLRPDIYPLPKCCFLPSKA